MSGWTKLQFIIAGFDEIGLASYVFDLEASELQTILNKMDAMLAKWNGKGIRIGYPLPSSQSTSNINDETNVPDSANEAIYTNLAIRIAPSVGKTVSAETKASAKDSYDVLLSRATMPNEMQFPGFLPAGAGNKPWRRINDPFVQEPVDLIAVGPDDVLNFY